MNEKTKILLIDDDPLICALIKDIFQDDGYLILEAGDGAAGIEMAIKEVPHLVVVDIMLPNVPGYEVIEALRKNPKVKHVPILACTAKNRSVDIHNCFDSGANDYIAKPFDLKQFRYKIKKLLGHPLPQV